MARALAASVEAAETIPGDHDMMAAVFRAARKHCGLNQTEVAHHLQISQGTVSKLENGQLVPDIFVWLRFCELTDIPERACVRGYVERKSLRERLTVLNQDRVGRFRLPEKYAKFQAASVRQVNVLRIFADQLPGFRNLVGNLHDRLGVEPDYFVDLRNQISHQYLYDGIEFLAERGALKPQDLDEFAQCALGDFSLGDYREVFSTRRSAAEFLNTYASYYPCLDRSHSLIVEKQGEGFDLVLDPDPGMRELQAGENASAFMPRFLEKYFERLLGQFIKESFRASLPGPWRPAERCVIKLRK